MGRKPIYGAISVMDQIRWLLADLPVSWTSKEIACALPWIPRLTVGMAVATMSKYYGYEVCCLPNVRRTSPPGWRPAIFRTAPPREHEGKRKHPRCRAAEPAAI